MKRSLILLLALVSLAVAFAGCKQIAKWTPASTIDNPSEGTPEFLIYKTIEAAQVADAEASYKQLRPYLHSSLLELSTSENNFVNLNWAAFRRKVRLFTPEDGKPTFKRDYTEEDQPDKEIRVFIVNEGSEMPSPFRIARDPNASNEWRVKNIP